jgi:hypothetical protein
MLLVIKYLGHLTEFNLNRLVDFLNGSTYWTKKDSEKAGIFRKVEPHLTFLNIPQLERQGADIQSKVKALEGVNQSLRNRDKLKDDAISQLSARLRLVALSTRLQEIERRQQLLT